MESNPWRPLGEVVKRGVPCEFETNALGSRRPYKWTGTACCDKNGAIEFDLEYAKQPCFRMAERILETVESVLEDFGHKVGPSGVTVDLDSCACVRVWVPKVKSVEHAKRIREAFLTLYALIKE